MTCINPPLFVVLVFALIVASAAGSEELAGTRPGPVDQPLTIKSTLFLLDVSKIDGANQSFTADVFMMLQWQDRRLATPEGGVRRLPLASVWNPRVQIINQRRVWKTFPEQCDEYFLPTHIIFNNPGIPWYCFGGKACLVTGGYHEKVCRCVRHLCARTAAFRR
jgi:hypothetical protein